MSTLLNLAISNNMNQASQERKDSQTFWRQLYARHMAALADLSVLALAFVLAYLLRFDFEIPRSQLSRLVVQLSYVVLLQFAAMLLSGVHMFIWRYIGLRELKAFINAALWSTIPLFVLRLTVPEQFQLWRVPISVIVMDAILGFGGTLGIRVLRRVLYEQVEKQKRRVAGANHKKPVLLIGAGRAGMLTAREIQNRGDMDIVIKGFVDDSPEKQGSVLHGVKVLGITDDLPRLVHELRIDHVVISMAQVSRQQIKRIRDICDQIPVKMQVIPGIYEILQGRVRVTRIRDVQIEDVLGREPVELDEASISSFISGKTVMVTGAGGSIGSELARQVAQFHPSQLLLVERAEFALFNIEREMHEAYPELSITALVADVGDAPRMRAIFSEYQTHVVLHAAAHKHVPLMESNATEAIKNNVLATRTLGVLAGEYGVDAFVLISTDKAVRPTSIMGASKRVAELVIQDLNTKNETRYVAVRFGNVIGSAGSVIPIFREQILKGGPVTVTHPNVVRYFMTIPEAAQLVLEAGAMGNGGEIFILDMGDPVRILDLAKDIIALSGLKPFEEIDIVFTGLRPGEKLFEELVVSEENAEKTRHSKILIGRIAPYSENKLSRALETLSVLAQGVQDGEINSFLQDFLPEAQLTVPTSATPAAVFEAELSQALVASA